MNLPHLRESLGVVCMILRLAILVQCQLVMEGHTTTAYSIASCGIKNIGKNVTTLGISVPAYIIIHFCLSRSCT